MNVRRYTKNNIKKIKNTTITHEQAKAIADQWIQCVDYQQGTMPNWLQCSTVEDLTLVAHFLTLDGSGVIVAESYKFYLLYDEFARTLEPDQHAVGQVIGAYCLFRISKPKPQTLH